MTRVQHTFDVLTSRRPVRRRHRQGSARRWFVSAFLTARRWWGWPNPFRVGWQTALAGLGAISLITVVVALFLPFGKGPSVLRLTAPLPAAGSPQFVRALSDVLTAPVGVAPRPVVFNNGDAFLKALLSDIDHAKASINFMAYIWEDGKFSDILLSHLEQKLKQGVQVRIVLDGYGSIRAPSGKFDRFRQLGGRTAVFHTLMPLPWAMVRDHKRNHRRAIIIDGQVGYTGGIAVADTWLGNARNSSEWRDMMFRVQGTAVAHLQAAFAEIWELGTGEILAGKTFYPEAAGETGSGVTYLPFVSSPSVDTFGMENLFLLSFGAAQKSILVVTPYFLPDRSIRGVLCQKAHSGVAVRVLVPNHYNDSRWVRYASQYYYDELLRCGVLISEYQPTFIHTKLLVIDGQWAVIGSANMDNRSRKLNDEIVLGISDREFANDLTQVIEADEKRARRISLEEWERRGIADRAVEVIALLSVQQY